MREKAHWVRLAEAVRVCSDPDDNIFLECAQAAGAAYLVTGNPRHFPDIWHYTRIVTARQLLNIVGDERARELEND